VYNGVDLSLNLRLPRGVNVQGGTSTGREVSDNCGVVGLVNNPAGSAGLATLLSRPFTPSNIAAVASPSSLYCRVAPPYQTQFKLLAIYPLPWHLETSATLQSLPGPSITATYVASNAQIAPSLGRNLSGGVNATANVELIAPGSQFGDRLNQLDLRLERKFTVGRARIKAQFDVYNALNANPVVALNTQYGTNGSAWLAPQFVLPGRLFKFGGQLDF
jgi:hypothetical protein